MRVREVKYIKEYKLQLTFSDETVKIVDLETMIKKSRGIFLPLKDIEYFKKVALDDCQLSICWPNGADICPDVLYAMGKTAKTQSSQKSKTRSNQHRRAC